MQSLPWSHYHNEASLTYNLGWQAQRNTFGWQADVIYIGDRKSHTLSLLQYQL